jgi:hypothetical protein
MVLTGETGSGKTTQIPQYLAAEAGWKGRIAVTQVFNFFNFIFAAEAGWKGRIAVTQVLLCSVYCVFKSLCCICR